ncbi:hypothetical protein LZK98_11415 [Sphingomonas cannabina]|uniref:hypothetical protein n=1 Tax=Sphingomonas cannabina TaxID=2899123 RepID=UPI001F3DDB9F|nr:hypothetical protein [Sphingomonas cannabina]UIJ43698.1 hypothetical protein LZK98_11415 [Sphingomonas cannabina]
MGFDPTPREWARESEVADGTELIADAGFTCITPGAIVAVRVDDEGGCWVPCSHGRHYLDGQLSTAGRFIGFMLANRAPEASAEGAIA